MKVYASVMIKELSDCKKRNLPIHEIKTRNQPRIEDKINIPI